MTDDHDLSRFLQAQADSYDQALSELKAGQKRSHWMWYVFPQIQGLGRSATAQHYAIKSRAEAEAYLKHPTLGQRLRECAGALLTLDGLTAHQILGSPDDLKLKSSMTLFNEVAGGDPVFSGVLDKYYGGENDSATLALLSSQQ
ncbi:hypothetical protein AUP74_00694 [Microbulbifer aggregans]|uniref:Calpastatin n=1 Tax=Microbulbifer aggregans TaxID=1769779 RepID=A0A1C9W4V9_9GAMM|nr:DUF1810 domain-containing protein [Microbulbifer aggregans]AOS96163.1 hypothetical protein AUP74_00694 [Microbulbifer aggregans]